MAERLTDADVLLEDLTPEQRDAVTTSATPLCIVAGAGSGKTRVVTRRIAWQAATGTVDPRRVLAVTFTRRAAGELRRRTRALGLRDDVAAGTFHSIALAILRNHWKDSDRRAPELLERRCRSSPGNTATSTALDRRHRRRDRVGPCPARHPDQYADAAKAARRRPGRSLSFVADIYGQYEEAKRKRKLVDFDDLLALCHATMTQDTRFAEAQRWRHRHVLVDEFQDVNPLQFALPAELARPESSLVVVGDPNQAIYGWNGAKPELLDEISDHLPGCALIHLRTNFRSTPRSSPPPLECSTSSPSRLLAPGDEPSVRRLDAESEAVAMPARCGSSQPGARGGTRPCSLAPMRSSRRSVLHSSVPGSPFVPGATERCCGDLK